MKTIVLLRSAWQALLKNKKRSLLTMLGIIIGIAAVSTIISIGIGFENYLIASLNPEDEDRLTVNIWFQADDVEWLVGTSEELFSIQDRRIIEQVDGVEEVDFSTLNIDRSFEEVLYNRESKRESIELVSGPGSTTLLGRRLDQIDKEMRHRVAVLPISIAEELDNDLENLIGRGIRIVNQNYTIIGIYETTNSQDNTSGSLFQVDGIEVPYTTFTHYNGEHQDNNELEIVISDDYLPSEVANNIVELLSEDGSIRQRGTYQYTDLGALDDGLALVLRGITSFIASIAAISLLIAGIGVMNMMYISVSERTKEIGIRRAMGATQNDIRRQFVLESILMTVIGGVLGYILGILFAYSATLVLPFVVGVDLTTISIALGISMGIGLIFSYAPANAAANKEIVKIL